MVRDLTQGKPWKVLLLYSLPLFGSIFFQQLYNAADSFVAGRYINTQALAAVGNAYEITLVYIAFAFGSNIGTSVITARYFGLKDIHSLKTTVYTALLASGAIGVVLIILGLSLSGPLLALIQTSSDIFADCQAYLNIYIGGFLFVLVYNIATGVFSALGDSRTPFIFLVISSLSNIFMDIFFVRDLHMGVPGVAWATFICQGLSGLAALFVMLRRLHKLEGGEKPRAFSLPILKEISVVAIPSILQQGFISVGNVIIQGFINSFGTAATGGYAAAIKLNNTAVLSLTAMGNGMSNYSAQNVGGKKPQRIRAGHKAATLYSLILSVLFALLFVLLGRPLVELFINDGNQDALDIGVQFLDIVSPYYFIIALKLSGDGVLRGTGRMGAFTLSTLTDLIIRVVLAAILSNAMNSLLGIWYAWPIGWALGTAMALLFYYRAQKADFDILPEAAGE